MQHQARKTRTMLEIVVLFATTLLCAAPGAVFGHDDDEPLGPFGPWSEPVNLGPVVNSPFDDTHPAISKNGLSLFITSGRPGGVNRANLGQFNEIWVSQRSSLDADWGSPQNLGPVINSFGRSTGVPNFSTDGHLMFFNSARPGGCGAADLYVARRKNKRDDFGWQAPVNLGCTINSAAADNGPTYWALSRCFLTAQGRGASVLKTSTRVSSATTVRSVPLSWSLSSAAHELTAAQRLGVMVWRC